VTAARLIPSAQAEVLVREIAQQTKEECGALTTTAEREARAVVADAHASARRRMHEAIVELRREAARRLARARAAAETTARQRTQRRATETIARAWPLLLEALAAQWRDAAGRRAWCDGVARVVRDRITAGMLTIEHPADWPVEEQRDLRSALGRDSDAVAFTACGDLTAGIRVKAGQATLDATLDGLLADREAITALLLAEIDSGDGR